MPLCCMTAWQPAPLGPERKDRFHIRLAILQRKKKPGSWLLRAVSYLRVARLFVRLPPKRLNGRRMVDHRGAGHLLIFRLYSISSMYVGSRLLAFGPILLRRQLAEHHLRPVEARALKHNLHRLLALTPQENLRVHYQRRPLQEIDIYSIICGAL